MRVLLVHMRYFPDATGTAPLVTQLSQDLAQENLDVVVITSLPHYGRVTIHPDFQQRKGYFHRNREKGVDVIRTPVFIPRNRGNIQRALNYLSYNFNSLIAGLFVNNVDLVLAINPPITTTFSAWILSILHRAPLIVGIQDVWPDCIVQVGQLKNPALIWISKVLEQIQYKIAKYVVVLSSGMKKNLISKKVESNKIAVIANWADLDDVIPLEKENHFYKTHKLDGKFVVLFAGNHGYIAALESIIETAELIKDQDDVLFLFAGEGSVKQDIIDLSKEKGLNNIRFLSTLPRDEWIEMMSASDLGLVTLRRDLAGLNVPSKVYTLMAAARPILASVPTGSEVAQIIKDAGCGFVTPAEEPMDLANQILECRNNIEDLEAIGNKGREYLLIHLNRKGQTDLYLDLIRSAVSKEKLL
jgi:colanic acid biosynthesis glycosyl transferase WcaI